MAKYKSEEIFWHVYLSGLPAAVLVVPVMQPADWQCCLLQRLLAVETNWLDTRPKELHNTEEEQLLALTKRRFLSKYLYFYFLMLWEQK